MFLTIGKKENYKFSTPSPTYHRHKITEPEHLNEEILKLLRKHFNRSVKNSIITTLLINTPVTAETLNLYSHQ